MQFDICLAITKNLFLYTVILAKINDLDIDTASSHELYHEAINGVYSALIPVMNIKVAKFVRGLKGLIRWIDFGAHLN